MHALTVIPMQKNSMAIREVNTPEPKHNEVLLKTIRVGICGTDREINEGLYGEAPPDSSYLILGHESVTRVEQTGDSVSGFSRGELVVPTVRRPCPELCLNCRNYESDMCLTGNYSEHGIRRLHGFASEYCTSDYNFLVKVPERFTKVATLLEPMSVVEKAIFQLYKIQNERVLWKPKKALVIGAGPIGLLATARFLLKDIEVWTAATRTRDSLRASIAEDLEAHYVNVRETPLKDLAPFDIIVEASGNLAAAAGAIDLLANNGAMCLLGIFGVDQTLEGFAKRFTEIVLGNKIFLGSVNANRRYFELGLEHFSEIQERKGDILERLITKSMHHESYQLAFENDGEEIKSVLEF